MAGLLAMRCRRTGIADNRPPRKPPRLRQHTSKPLPQSMEPAGPAHPRGAPTCFSTAATSQTGRLPNYPDSTTVDGNVVAVDTWGHVPGHVSLVVLQRQRYVVNPFTRTSIVHSDVNNRNSSPPSSPDVSTAALLEASAELGSSPNLALSIVLPSDVSCAPVQ